MADIYDEFGNYIGPELELDDEDEDDDDDEDEEDDDDDRSDEMRNGGRHDDIDDRGNDLDDDDIAMGDRGGSLMTIDNDNGEGFQNGEDDDGPIGMEVVLHEDKKYYPSAEEVYGVETETMLQDEDAQPLEQPIIAPMKTKSFEVSSTADDDDGPTTPATFMKRGKRATKLGMTLDSLNVDLKYLKGVCMKSPRLNRTTCITGHLHHGKTSILDVLIEQTHNTRMSMKRLIEKPPRYTDNRYDEQERCMSMKCKPVSLVMESSKQKSHMFNFIDTPGHPNYNDEVAAAMRLSDGVILMVDAVEGVMMATDMAVKQAAIEGLPIVLVLSKMDRLITELKLPPNDAYHKIRHTILEVNKLIAKYFGEMNTSMLVDPAKGNVAFSSGLHGWSFTLKSFAEMYLDINGVVVSADKLAKKLWGEHYYHSEKRTFSTTKPDNDEGRSFVSFVLEPLYKIYSTVIGEDATSLQQVMAQFGVNMKKSELGIDVSPLLRLCCTKVFGNFGGIADMILKHIPSIHDGNATKVRRTYTGPILPHPKLDNSHRENGNHSNGASKSRSTERVHDMLECDASGKLMVMVSKLYPRASSGTVSESQENSASVSFDALGRIMSGTLRVGQQIRVLGEGYTPDDDEDSIIQTVTDLMIYNARYRIKVNEAQAGNVVLIGGIDKSIFKTATLCDLNERGGGGRFGDQDDSDDDDDDDDDDLVYIFKPLQFVTSSVIKIATEPLNPAELPKMVDGLRSINKTYPMCTTKVEESGEHTILGTGELYLDSLMRDLREAFSDIEIKVADPVVSFCETVSETSSMKCFSETPNKLNKLTMIAEPLDKGLAEDIEAGKISLGWGKKAIGKFFQTNYEWDLLAARSVWAFGPESQSPNVLLDDTLPGEVDKSLLNAVRMSITQGFQWASREGPLCDEPMRGVKLKVLDATIADEGLQRGGGQIIPTARRVAYSSFLTATPRMMEPILLTEITTPADCMSAIYNVISRRRGHVLSDSAIPGTPIYSVKAFIPAIESFGYETDLRYHTQGQGFGMSVFDHWALVPGDPLDKNILLRPLEPAPPSALAREFMVKTRRRKGMSEDVSITKFFDQSHLAELAEQDEDEEFKSLL